MGRKEFFKLTKRKIIIFIILMVIVILVFVYSCKSCMLLEPSLCNYPTFCNYSLVYFALSVIISYLISCLIIRRYRKIK